MRKLLLCLVLVFSFNCIFLADYNTVYANDDYLIPEISTSMGKKDVKFL